MPEVTVPDATVPGSEPTFRVLRRSDAPAMLAVDLAAEAAEPADHHTDLGEVEESLSGPTLRLQDSIAVLDGGQLIGYGTLQIPGPAESWTAFLWIAVLPGHRRQGIGREVLDRLTAAAAAVHLAEHPELPAELRAFVPQGRDDATAFLAAEGFTTRRHFLGLRRDLSAASLTAAVPPPGIRITAWTPENEEATRLAYNASFADHWGSVPASPERWRHMFADAGAFRPQFSRLALSGDRVVGFVLVDEFDSETAARGYRAGYIDRVGTLREFRGTGVASALLADCLLALRDGGCRDAELEVDSESSTGAGRLYERLGFVLAHRNQVVGREIRRIG